MSDDSGRELIRARHGRKTGLPGLVARELSTRRLISLVARQHRTDQLATILRQLFALQLPTSPRWVHAGDISLIWSGPGCWLLETETLSDHALIGLEATLRPAAAFCDQSDSRRQFELAGTRVREVLSKGVPIDLHQESFNVGDVALTAVAHINVQLWQVLPDPVYRVFVARSYGGSFTQWLLTAAAEYGCEIR